MSDMHLTEEEQLKAFKLLGDVATVGNAIFENESQYGRLYELLGPRIEHLAMVVSDVCEFMRVYGDARRLGMN